MSNFPLGRLEKALKNIITILADSEFLYRRGLGQGCQTHFYWGHISLAVAFKGPNVISAP